MNSTLTRVLSYSKKYWKSVVFSVVATSIGAMAYAVPMYALQYVVDKVFIEKAPQYLFALVALFWFSFLAKGIFMFISSYLMSWVGIRVVSDLRKDFLNKVIRFPIVFFRSRNSGDLVSAFLHDIGMVQHAASGAIKEIARCVCEAVFLFIVAMHQNFKLTTLTFFVAPVIFFVVKRLLRSMGKSAKQMSLTMADTCSQLSQLLAGIKEIKVFKTESNEVEKMSEKINSYSKSFMKNSKIEAVAPILTELTAMFGCSIIMYMAARQVIAGQLTPGQLTSFLTATILAYQPIRRMGGLITEVQKDIAAAGRVFSIMDLEFDDQGLHKCYPSIPAGEIRINDVSFSYPGKSTVIDQISLKINEGDKVGIIGPSGIGKTTIGDLVLNLVHADSGTIEIGCSKNKNMPSMAFVGQSPFLFDGTISENVSYGLKSVTQESIRDACKRVYADEFIQKLPDKYESRVGENGALLSGGQVQRLAIARAILREPSILVLDEILSALDQESEKIICRSVKNFPKTQTVIAISHKESLMEVMDIVYRLDSGKLFRVDL